MENAEKAIMMAFAVMVLVIALALAIYMFSEITVTSEQLTFYTDSTVYYDNVQLTKVCEACDKVNSYDNIECEACKNPFTPDADEDGIKSGATRVVSTDTIIPTLYRYYKENFCVKIYDADNNLVQIFDVNLEGKVHGATGDTLAGVDNDPTHIRNHAYNQVYNDTSKEYCLFGAPWLGSTDAVKARIDYFVNGKSGYINNSYVDYEGNKFWIARENKKQFSERFINYSYSGQKMITEDGDELVTGEKSKDKIVIIYTEMN